MAAPVFDTNILIDWLCDRSGASAELARYTRHRISRLSWAEVLAGEPSDRRTHVAGLLSFFEIIEVDSRIALAGAAIRHRNRMKLIDAIILATAQVNDSILVTRNTKDFPANMPGIRVPYTL
ncbi:Ribonuclease VapC [Sphingomonas antarctica]|uniref:type II toxin-antitoxin system VapC family toxin n=1 Tax=Sphingomonas antarctica TaxID=2040274 RepID=UPI0039E78D78